ncbi:hypothetical protein CALCODRAFT_487559 [Calocera cornea HHB12733]|uniref:Uncharacterized protein n=1 Tax=Calocera cornea HHB12733 TaxID=1353952 RepID=A0A165D210_9BASI|nr:hypothetical protein CALCODRAFT_487559 [Calocera cornea HHB12733]
MEDGLRRTPSVASNFPAPPPDYDSSQQVYFENLDRIPEEPRAEPVLAPDPPPAPVPIPPIPVSPPAPSVHPSLPHSDSQRSTLSTDSWSSTPSAAIDYRRWSEQTQAKAQDVYARAMEEARQGVEQMGLGIGETRSLEAGTSRIEPRASRPPPIDVVTKAPELQSPLTTCGCTCKCCLEKCAIGLPLSSGHIHRGAPLSTSSPNPTVPTPGSGNSDSPGREREEGKMFSMPLMSIVMPVLMTDEMQRLASRSAGHALNVFDAPALTDIAGHIRDAFEAAFPHALWHVVVGEDWTWAVTYEKMHYMVFIIKSVRFIIYASPGEKSHSTATAIGRIAHPHVASRFPTSTNHGARIHGIAMDSQQQTIVTQVANGAFERYRQGRSRPNTIAAEIKEELSRTTQTDKTISWHVIVGNDHGSSIAYTQFLHFSVGTLTCLVWKTQNKPTTPGYRPHAQSFSVTTSPPNSQRQSYTSPSAPRTHSTSPNPPNPSNPFAPTGPQQYYPIPRSQPPPPPQPSGSQPQHRAPHPPPSHYPSYGGHR